MKDIGYVWEKFHSAVSGLASGDSPLRQRLVDAWVGALMRLDADDLPPENQSDFSEMEAKITSVEPVGDEGSFAASAKALTDIEAIRMAEKIVSIYDNVCRSHYRK